MQHNKAETALAFLKTTCERRLFFWPAALRPKEKTCERRLFFSACGLAPEEKTCERRSFLGAAWQKRPGESRVFL
tara:strand:- start:777 stop:1001 length:225 start_codon:yes stop_codon:yes gene_type:complete